MKLDQKTVRTICELAKLECDESQIEHFLTDLNSIFGFIETMNQADTNGVTAMSHPFDIEQRLRDDHVTEKEARDQLQASAPLAEAGLYLVPKVIE